MTWSVILFVLLLALGNFFYYKAGYVRGYRKGRADERNEARYFLAAAGFTEKEDNDES